MSNYTFFWGKQDFLSQWYPCVFRDQHYQYNCAEQFMMAYKAITFKDSETWRMIMGATDPKNHKYLGRQVKNFDEKVWNERCQAIVYLGNKYKFEQNTHLLKALLETKGELVEASPYDKIWGIGLTANDPRSLNKETWQGTNWLGQLLTMLREELRVSTESIS